MIEQGSDQGMAKKSLINSFENLQSKANQLAEVRELSDKMIRKFQRTDNVPMNKVSAEEKVLSPLEHDIIDLFNDLATDFQNQIATIRDNIAQMIDWIE